MEEVYCDDVRQEARGKLAWVGGYSDSMIASQVLDVSPYLCVLLQIVVLVDRCLEPFVVRITHDDEVFAEVNGEGVSEDFVAPPSSSVITNSTN